MSTPLPVQQFKSTSFQQYLGNHFKDYDEVPETKSNEKLWGFSLNERLLGKRIAPQFDTENGEEFPSFSLGFDVDTPILKRNVKQSFSSGIKTISDDPFLVLAMQQYEREMTEADTEKKKQLSISTKKPCGSTKSFIPATKSKQKQVVFADDFEHNFYVTLTTSVAGYRFIPESFF